MCLGPISFSNPIQASMNDLVTHTPKPTTTQNDTEAPTFTNLTRSTDAGKETLGFSVPFPGVAGAQFKPTQTAQNPAIPRRYWVSPEPKILANILIAGAPIDSLQVNHLDQKYAFLVEF